MDYYYLSFLVCLSIALCAAIHVLLPITKKGNPRRLPPGPPPLPIFGNLFSLGDKPHVSLAKYAKKYGPLITLQVGRVTTVVISSSFVAKEAFQKNDLALSNRMVVEAHRALNHDQNSVVFLPVGSHWRNLRKICNSQVFSISKLEASQSLRKDKVRSLISYVRKCSKEGIAVDIGQAALVTTLNVLSNTFFSSDLADFCSESAREFKEIERCILEEEGRPNVADYFPFLRKMDPQGVRRRATVYLQKMFDIFNSVIDERLQGRKPTSSFQTTDVLDALLGINQEKAEEIHPSHIPDLLVVHYLLLKLGNSPSGKVNCQKKINMYINPVQDLFVAGTDTTSSTVEWAMAELLRNPEKMKKAKAELNEIIGKGKPIEESDISRLPYLQAVVKETFRIHPSVPFLIPRRAVSDVSLFGFTVPKNAQVLVNVWAIGRDPEIWENPSSFQPERFVGSEIDVKGRDYELIPFGSGRRICPGLPLATRMIHLMLGSLIHEFNWELEPVSGTSPEELNMDERFGFTLEKAHRLRAIPICKVSD